MHVNTPVTQFGDVSGHVFLANLESQSAKEVSLLQLEHSRQSTENKEKRYVAA